MSPSILHKTDEEKIEDNNNEGIVVFGVQMKRNFSKANFMVIPMTLGTITYIGTFINVAIIFLLKDPLYFGITDEYIGRVSNDIIFYS